MESSREIASSGTGQLSLKEILRYSIAHSCDMVHLGNTCE